MIETLVYTLLAIGNSLFDAFVFMFGWNTVIHKIGFPEISYIVSYGICLFIGYVKSNDTSDKEGEEWKGYIRNKIVLGIVNNIVYIVLFVVYRWIVG
jgi:hypothetical protein